MRYEGAKAKAKFYTHARVASGHLLKSHCAAVQKGFANAQLTPPPTDATPSFLRTAAYFVDVTLSLFISTSPVGITQTCFLPSPSPKYLRLGLCNIDFTATTHRTVTISCVPLIPVQTEHAATTEEGFCVAAAAALGKAGKEVQVGRLRRRRRRRHHVSVEGGGKPSGQHARRLRRRQQRGGGGSERGRGGRVGGKGGGPSGRQAAGRPVEEPGNSDGARRAGSGYPLPLSSLPPPLRPR